MPTFAGLLVKVGGNQTGFERAAEAAFGARADKLEPILHMPAEPGAGPGLAASLPMTWYRVGHAGAEHPWDAVHDLLRPGSLFAAAAGNVVTAEPNLEQGWLPNTEAEAAADSAAFCKFNDQDDSGQQARGPGNAWNVDKDFSAFKQAREQVGDKLKNIVIAHLDTGYDPNHITRPKNLADAGLHRNFVDDGFPLTDATDHVPRGKEFVRNRGHGT